MIFILYTNFKQYFLTEYWIPFALMYTGYGRIVNMSSQMGVISTPKKGVYSAIKSGLIGLTKVIISRAMFK